MESRSGLPILDFADGSAFEAWLGDRPADALGLWLRIAKKDAGVGGITKREAIDAALCHGWIDGQADPYDDRHWLTRFTPRKRRSPWSQVNRERALELIAVDRMQPRGYAQIAAAHADGRWDAAYAPASRAVVPHDLQRAFDAHPRAAAFFATLTGANRYAILYRIGKVKRADTRARKIVAFIAMLERHETIHG